MPQSPDGLRGYLHRDPALRTRVVRIFLEEIERALQRQRMRPSVRIVAFNVETVPFGQILRHIGQPTVPPVLYPPRGPPDELLAEPIVCLDDDVTQDRYEFEADQRLSW